MPRRRRPGDDFPEIVMNNAIMVEDPTERLPAMGAFSLHTPPAIRFEPGALARLGALAGGRLGGRVLVVTDRGLTGLGLVQPALDSLGVETVVFDGVKPDPSRASLLAAVEAGRGATGVLGIGGGSPMDVAKLAALLLGSGEDLDAAWGVGNAKGPRLPLVLVPTTAGTGSEVTPVAIITVEAAEKRGVSSPLLLPDLAVLDPDLTLRLPPPVTAATGIDAMVHAIEAYTSRAANANPVSRALAVEALRLLGASIHNAVHLRYDPKARRGMMLGAMLAGQAFANAPVAAVHALAYPIGGLFHVPHGLSNALVLPHVLRFNAAAAAADYAVLAPVVFPDLDPGADPQAQAEAFAGAMAELALGLGLPARLRDVGVGKDDLARCAAEAMKQTRLLVNNPREVTEADARAIYEAAW
jgi:alcohol dehydrogenase class IV